MKVQLPKWDSAPAVLVVGDVMLDRYWYGGTSRISPEAPVPVVHVNKVEERVGGAGNVALNIAALGGQAEVVGVVGEDEAASALADCLQKAGVMNRLVTHEFYPTVTKLRVISRHQQLIRMDFEDGFESVPVAELRGNMEAALADCAVVVLSDYGKGVLADPQTWIQLARQHGKPVLVDPKSKDFSVYRGATVVTPNLSEFEEVVGSCKDENEIVTKGKALLLQYDIEALLVTRGEQGMTLIQATADAIHLPTQAQEVYDVTGAGDTVISVMAATLAAGEALETAMFLANVAAGIVVGKLGTATVQVTELHQALHDLHEFRYGILNADELFNVVEACQARGESVVMTNGCFDLLHAGHVQYLEEARKLGDRLIVAVNSDASVRQLKGEQRPINPLDQRMAVLAALASVDWVVSFAEETPEQLYCHLLPDVLVKGGDYQVSEVAGGQCVIDKGGEVRILSFKDGCSTSKVIANIQKFGIKK